MAFNFSRYDRRILMTNASPTYAGQLLSRGVFSIRQYRTPNIKYPTEQQMRELIVEKLVWATGTRFYKLAHTYYNDSSLWWIIPWFNQKPLETDFKLGDVVMVPLPLTKVLSFYNA